MATELTEIERKRESMPIKLPGISDVPGRAKEIHELIARRAYQIYEGRGHTDGHDIEDWLQAESEVRATLFVGFMELNGDLRVDIGIRACDLPALQVRIEPWRLIVSGKRNVHDRQMEQGDLAYRGDTPRPVEIFEVVNFPVRVEPPGAKATFSNELLELRIPKSVKKKKSVAARAA